MTIPRLSSGRSARRAIFISGLLGFPCMPAGACDWSPEISNRRVVSPSGRRYVVVRKNSWMSIRFELCERREGAAPIEAVVEPSGLVARRSLRGRIDRDPEDAVLACGLVDHLPGSVFVLESGGFVLFGASGRFVMHDIASTHVDDQGRIAARRRLQELRDPGTGEGRGEATSAWWARGQWFDHQRMALVVLSEEDQVRVIALADGCVAKSGIGTLAGPVRHGSPAERALALEAAARVLGRSPRGTGRFDPLERIDLLERLAEGIAMDPGEPLGLRLRAAVLLERAGRQGGHGALFLEAIGKGQARPERAYAIEHLAQIGGLQVLPVLKESLLKESDPGLELAYRLAFASLEEKGVPTLVEILVEAPTGSDVRRRVVDILAQIRSPKAVAPLLQAAQVVGAHAAGIFIDAAIRIGAPDLPERLGALLSRDVNQDGRIALYFRKHPDPKAIPALEAALDRSPPGGLETDWISAALEACRKAQQARH